VGEQFHRALHVGEQDSDLFALAFEGGLGAQDSFNDLPVKYVNGAMVYVRDVGHVRDGFAVQTNIVRQDGRRSALLTVIKKGGASTLTIVKQLKELLPTIRAAAPPGLEIRELFDQSLFVRAAVAGVLIEGAIAAFLTAVMILLFLGGWRSTLVVITSIPLSILTSLAILGAIGQTFNVMTLGGLALAVGILVDDATVEIENIHRNLGLGTRLVQAILDGAQQIAAPAFVSTLSICIVFVPVVFLTGPREVFVHAARHGRGVRHAGLVSALAYDRADACALPAGE
jgi:multidrug efflux pump subunit AcrB